MDNRQMAAIGRQVAVIGGSTGIGLETARLLAGKGAQVTIGGRNRDRLDAAVKELDGGVQAVPVDAEQVDSLRQFFAEAGPISDLVVTVTRRGGAGPVAALADADLPGAFTGKTVAHLRAVALALPTLAADGSITLVTAVSARRRQAGGVRELRPAGPGPPQRPSSGRGARDRRAHRERLHHRGGPALRRRAAPHLSTRGSPGGDNR